MKKDYIDPGMNACPNCPPESKAPAWQDRLIGERVALMAKLKDLDAAFEDKDFKLSAREWELLSRQRCAMRDYAETLTMRCIYYGLISDDAAYRKY